MMSKGWVLLILVLAVNVATAGPAEAEDLSDEALAYIPVYTPQHYDINAEYPAPVWDTNRVYAGSSSNLTRKVAIGRYFKGATDDTLRVIAVQSGGTRNLVIATDTTSTAFGKEKFRIEEPYSFTGGTPHPVTVGDIDGDAYTDIVAAMSASPYRVIWFEWDGANWVARDSFAVNAGVWDLTIGDANNDGNANELLVPIYSATGGYSVMHAVWTGTAWDTTRIIFSQPTYPRCAVIADIRPDLAGNEFYVSGTSAIGMAYWNGTSWDTSTVATGLASTVYGVTAGDVDGNLTGDELAAVHSSSSYQLSVWNWDGAAWQGRAWRWLTTSIGSYSDIEVGDILTDNPGNEVVVAGASSTQYPAAFWLAPDGSGWVSTLPKPVASQTQYGVAIGDINRFRAVNDEFVLTGYGTIVEVEQYVFVNDIGTYWVSMHNPTSIINLQDTITVAIFNSGSAAQSGFSVGYSFKTNPASGSVTYSGTLASGAIDSVKIPIILNALGWDTLYVFTNLAGDGYAGNDTSIVHMEVYDDSTRAASGFNASGFPPQDWTATILAGTYNWDRYTSPTLPTAPVLEGYAVAGYNSYSASAGSMARLRTHQFNIGPTPKKVMLRFYMFGDDGYATYYDSLYVQYSFDDINYTTVAGFGRIDTADLWRVFDVEIGDFAANMDLYVGFLAVSQSGYRMYIDSVRVFVTTATAALTDAGVMSIEPFPAPIFELDTLEVTVTLRNYGLNPLTTTPVFYTLGGADTTTETWTGSLLIGQTEDFTFATDFVPQAAGVMTLYAGTQLPGDQVPDNDTASTSFSVCPFSNIPPYSKDFEEDWSNSTNPPFCGWTIVDGGTQTPNIVDNNDWHRYYYSAHGSYVARVYYSPIEIQDDWLISPRFDCSAGGIYTLNYWHYYNDYTATRLDSGRVLVSTDEGTSWQTIAMYSNADDSGSCSFDVSSFVAGEPQVRFAFHYVAENEYWWYIDDFEVDFTPDVTGPVITVIEQPASTYLAGPYRVSAEITDVSGIMADTLYYIVDDVVTAVGHTSVAGDTISYDVPTQAPGTVIEYYIGAWDNLSNGSTSDHYSFWVLSPMAPSDLEVLGLADSTVQLDWLPPGEELSYHGAYMYYWFSMTGDMVATQFTPQHTPCRLEAASITFWTWYDSLVFYVWADDGYGNPGTVLYVDTLVNSQINPNAEIFDLTGEDIVVDGDFHVGYEWLNDTTPCLLCDAGANTSRSKYNVGAGWFPTGLDFLTTAVVSYIPPITEGLVAASRMSNSVVMPISSGRNERGGERVANNRLVEVRLEPVDAVGPGLLERILGISDFEVERSESQGGPYTSLGTTSQSGYIDTTVADETRYYYVVKANYTAPESASVYSNEVTIGIDFSPPAYANTTYDSLVGGPWVVSTDITDWTGLAYDSLAYRADGGTFAYVTHDSMSGNTYYYTIPSYPSYTVIDFYLFSEDSSWMQNAGRDPLTGYYSWTVTGIADYKPEMIPDRVFFNQNRPNPFSHFTQIEYGVPRSMHVNISVYNTAGQRVKTLADEIKAAGYYVVAWPGTDDLGRRLADGIYFMRFTSEDLKDTKKIIHVR
ncbi:MAG: T9SS type A sorting domain-containing protein [candidate division WOR-3 bacterium]|nr:MAG: T9SS type A sorting domain-containing protein [candidate division WOR-3 bacterium]